MTQPPTPPPGQPPYGSYPPNEYGQVPYGGYAAPDHPQAMLVLVLGILGLVMCPLTAPFAWVMGNRVIAEIDAGNGQVGGRSTANVGRICGIVGTALIALSMVIAIAAIAIIAIGAASTA